MRFLLGRAGEAAAISAIYAHSHDCGRGGGLNIAEGRQALRCQWCLCSHKRAWMPGCQRILTPLNRPATGSVAVKRFQIGNNVLTLRGVGHAAIGHDCAFKIMSRVGEEAIQRLFIPDEMRSFHGR